MMYYKNMNVYGIFCVSVCSCNPDYQHVIKVYRYRYLNVTKLYLRANKIRKIDAISINTALFKFKNLNTYRYRYEKVKIKWKEYDAELY
jgi:hypothetical protein